MSSASTFLARPDGEALQVLEWFRALDDPPEETATSYGAVLFFRHMGELAYFSDTPPKERLTKRYRLAEIRGDAIDAERSPLVSIVLPKVRRGILWGTGEVNFRPTPLSQFPELARVRTKFLKWLRERELVFESRLKGAHEWDYYLEGSVRNTSDEIYAFPAAFEALKAGQYFVGNDDGLERICRALRLRGVECLGDD